MTRRPSRATVATIAVLTSLFAAACSGGEPDGAGTSASTVTARMLPSIAQVGPDPASADDASAVVGVAVEPAVAGRALTLQRDTGAGWEDAGITETAADGTADFVLDDGAPEASYRVVAEASDDAAEATSAAVSPGGWEVTMADEFEGDELSEQLWYHRGAEYSPDSLRACSKGSPEAVEVSGGVVRLSVVKDPARPEKCLARNGEGKQLGRFDYRLNGHIATTATQQYGVTAARIKFPRERGQHGSLWYQSPIGYDGDVAETGAEIDIVEYFGEDGENRLASFIHYPTSAGDTREGDWIEDADRFLESKDDDWWKQFHVFSLEWTEDEYIIRIDGQEAWRTDQGVSQIGEFLVLSLLSSDYELPKLGGDEKLPQSMAVDWVRVFHE